MTEYFTLQPEASPTLGDNTLMDASVRPPNVSKLHLEFAGWLGDDLLSSFPCYIVTKTLADKLEQSGLGNFELRDVEVTVDEQYRDTFGELALPEFKWLHVTGIAGQDDIGLHRAELVVSQAALDVLRQGRLDECDIEPYTPEAETGQRENA